MADAGAGLELRVRADPGVAAETVAAHLVALYRAVNDFLVAKGHPALRAAEFRRLFPGAEGPAAAIRLDAFVLAVAPAAAGVTVEVCCANAGPGAGVAFSPVTMAVTDPAAVAMLTPGRKVRIDLTPDPEAADG